MNCFHCDYLPCTKSISISDYFLEILEVEILEQEAHKNV